MRFIVSLLILSLSLIAQAQTVEKVSGSDATVSIQGSERLKVGDHVSFLNDSLESSGQGEVTKVSESGKKAIVKITSGAAKAGMSLEKSSTASASAGSVNVVKDHNEDVEVVPRVPGTKYMDEEDRRIMRIGEISTAQYVIGGILGTYPLGLGIGHAIQGRYSDKGWIFTAGELGSVAVALAGAGDCVSSYNSNNNSCSGGLVVLGVAGYIGFRIWEIIDVWAAPPEINRRYRELKMQMKPGVTFSPILGPTKDGAVAGIQMTF